MTDPFVEFCLTAGITGDPILDENPHRFIGPDDTKDDSWYKGSIKQIGNRTIRSITVRNWKWADDEFLHYRDGMSSDEIKEYSVKSQESKDENEAEKERKQKEAQEKAQRIWADAGPSDGHEYLKRKGLTKTYGTKCSNSGELLIPVRDSAGRIWGLQKILPGGEKRFLSGMRKKGLCYAIPPREDKKKEKLVYVCEGFATAASVWEATGSCVFVAFDAGNLLPLCLEIRKMTDSEIIVAGDNDCWSKRNVGGEKAEEAARAVNGKFTLPSFDSRFQEQKSTDWNDFMMAYGLAATEKELVLNLQTPEKEPIPINTKKEKEVIGNLKEDIKKMLEEKAKSMTKEDSAFAKKLIKRLFYSSETNYYMAKDFLSDSGFVNEKGESLLKYYQQDFYRFKGDHYQILDEEWLVDKVERWLVEAEQPGFCGTKKVQNIINVLKTKPRYVPGQIQLPAVNTDSFDGPGEWEAARNLIPMTNGLLNVKTKEVLPHSPKYFFRNALKFAYDEKATCPIYDQICQDVFSSDEERMLWEEILGVHLYCEFPPEKMFLLCGQGANGKSVLVTVLTCLVGEENVSSVPLDCFTPNNFAFIETLGKLANVIGDMKDVSEVDEGAIKSFVSRDEMSFNRKNKPVVKARPTAFLTACTNVLPRFSDKTDGIWRRIILLNFKKQIPIEKQNQKYRNPDFWISSGELPGIFNKALAGAERVQQRGSFVTVKSVIQDVEEYRQELNYTNQFASDAMEFGEGLEMQSHDLYLAFKKMVTEHGGRPVAAKTFFNQLKVESKKLGHEVEISKKATRFAGKVGKTILGAKLNDYGMSFSQSDTSSWSIPTPREW